MRRIVCIWIPQWRLQRRTAARQGPEDIDDRDALRAWAAWCQRFSPTVGVEESPNPECLFMDITGLGHLFGGETTLLRKIVKDFADQGLAVRAAVADTLGAAWAVARFASDTDFLASNPDFPTGNPSLAAKTLRFATRIDFLARQGNATVDGGLAHFRDEAHENRTALLGRKEISAVFGPRKSQKTSQSPVRERLQESKLLAMGLVVPPGQSGVVLKRLPVEALRLPAETVELLHSLGIVRIEQLDRLPREEWNRRFGPRLMERWQQALGCLLEPIPAQLPPPKFAVRHELEHPTASRELVACVLEQLAARLSEILIARGRGALQLECRLDCQEDEPVVIRVGLFQPTASPRHLSQLMQMRLERISIPSPVVAISLESPLAGALGHRQEQLFADPRIQDRSRLLAILIDRLASRLGCRAVLRARLVPDDQPELAYRYDPVVSAEAGNAATRPVEKIFRAGSGRLKSPFRQNSTSSNAEDYNPVSSLCGELPPRPLRLLRRPKAVSVISIVPDGPPLCFRLRDQEQRITWIWGPERIETGWWRGHAIARDYYRIEASGGRRFWLFRDLNDGRWFLHGHFE